ncbi:unnamed protein product, partial [Effrenium voratum]
ADAGCADHDAAAEEPKASPAVLAEPPPSCSTAAVVAKTKRSSRDWRPPT